MFNPIPNDRMRTSRCWLPLMFLVLVVWPARGQNPENVTAGGTGQKTFASPAEAGTALLEAAKTRDRSALLAIFGPGANKVLFSGDTVKDSNAAQDFVDAYSQMNRWVKTLAGNETLYVGADNFPFPIPLAKTASDRWYFDTAAGDDEILARRIGGDELTAIAACADIADAQLRYFSQTQDGDDVKQYARKLVADDGKHNGLYWNAPEGQTPSPLGRAGDLARAAGYTDAGGKPQPFNGYYFRILTKQGDKAPGGAEDYIVSGKMTGGFAILAYPAEYRDSGIMTFIVGTDGVIFQKDLGEKTREIATAMTEYDPGDGWNEVPEVR